MFPGEPDSAMHLDVLGGDVKERLGTVRLGETGKKSCLAGVFVDGGTRGICGRGRRFDLQQHVRALVLDCLERSDRSTELLTNLGVLDAHLHGTPCAAHLLRGESRQAGRQGSVHRTLRSACGSDQMGWCAIEGHIGLSPRHVQGLERGDVDAVAGSDREEAGSGIGVCNDEDDVRRCSVEHEMSRARDGVAVGVEFGGDLGAVSTPSAPSVGECERRNHRSVGDPRQVLPARVGIAAGDQGTSGENRRGEERGAHQRAPHLLEHDL